MVEFRIKGYPGPGKEHDREVTLMRGEIFCGKIRMYFSVQNILLSSLLTSSFLFLFSHSSRSEVFPFAAFDVSPRFFGGFRRRCCGNANIEEIGFSLVGQRPSSD